MTSLRAALTKYNPNQPRAPRGSANGGQFVSTGGGRLASKSSVVESVYSDAGEISFRYLKPNGNSGTKSSAKGLWFNAARGGQRVQSQSDTIVMAVATMRRGTVSGTAYVTYDKDGVYSGLSSSRPRGSFVIDGHGRALHWPRNAPTEQATGETVTQNVRRPRLSRSVAARPGFSQQDWKAKKVDGLDVRVKATVSDTVFARFGGDTADVVGRILSGAKEHKLAVDVDYTSDSYGLYFSAKLRKGKNQVGSISRKFYDKKGSTPAYVYHDYFELDSKFQGQGIAKSIFRKAIPEYAKMGYKEVHVGAGLSEGGYAWAKYGFVPTKQSWSYLLDSVKYRATDPVQKKFLKTIKKSQPKDIWKIADSEFGHRLLAGTGWDGVLSFSDRDAMDRFTAYVGAATPPKRRTRTLKKAMTTPRTFVMAETLDPDTPPSMDTILRHRAELKARGADEETLDAAYPIRPLQKALRSKSDKLA